MKNWDDYRYFLAVAETGSLSAAARRLRVAQPTVGRRIQVLEEALGARLFDRLSHGYALTVLGESIREFAVRIEQDALAIERRVAGAEEQIAGKVNLTTAEGLGVYWLAAQLPALRQQFPQLEIELSIDMSLADLLRREADIALRVGTPGSDELVGRTIGKVSFGLYAAKAYLAAHGEPKKLVDLAKHTFIESTGGIAELKQVQLLRELAKQADIGLHCNHIATQLHAARAGLGLLSLPAYMAHDAADLRRVLRTKFDVQLDLWLLTHRDLRRSARIRAVMDFIVEAVARDAAIFAG